MKKKKQQKKNNTFIIAIVCIVLIVFISIFLVVKQHKSSSSNVPASKAQTPWAHSGKYIVTASEKQMQKLREIIKTNQEAKDKYDSLQIDADSVLKDSPNPADQIQTSHLLKGDPKKVKTQQSLKDMPKIYSLSFTYAITNDTKYGAKAKEFILAWANTNKPSGDPIDETNLEQLILGYDLLKNNFSSDEQKTVNNWLINSSQTLINNINSDSTSARNNHNSHLLKIVGMVGFVTENKKLIDYAINGYKNQIEQDLNPDGSSYDFYQRDALYYHVYTLEPLLIIARVADLNGLDLYHYVSPSGASLQKSFAWLLPYVTGQKSHAEWVNSTVAFDLERADNGQEEFTPGRLFDPAQAEKALKLNYYFDQSVLPLVLQFSDEQATQYPDFTIVFLDALRPAK